MVALDNLAQIRRDAGSRDLMLLLNYCDVSDRVIESDSLYARCYDNEVTLLEISSIREVNLTLVL